MRFQASSRLLTARNHSARPQMGVGVGFVEAELVSRSNFGVLWRQITLRLLGFRAEHRARTAEICTREACHGIWTVEQGMCTGT